MNDPSSAADKTARIKEFLDTLLASSGLSLDFTMLAADPQARSASAPEISVEFTGRDAGMLTARNGELLHAIEHLAAKVLRLEPEEHDRISFDAENFKVLRNRELQMIAEAGAERVRATNRPYAFPPMNSRERRLLHLALSESGLSTASTSDGPRRFVVAYPKGQQPAEQSQSSTHDRSHAIRTTFRRR
jgi:spoIIIJ-associated protein